ncbi:hypothetical protein [Demequina mangrovi]|uniref:DUF3179 domain-containing protein n=1 Tax=Demequina mangrovi TaxID=1043493 RepID=A0A1H6XLN1_9MICO|nr:hypothetical protein [Demequina mangrovi]SEJ25740.1 hypothetical protein SAMN05421637_1350 [Demequina mangrovi]
MRGSGWRVRACVVIGAGLAALGACSPAVTSEQESASESPPVAASSAEPAVAVAPSETPTPDTPVVGGLEAITEYVSDADWSFANAGWFAPIPIEIRDGRAEPDVETVYYLDEGVEVDMDGDGLLDAVIPIVEERAFTMQTLWYVWLAREGPDGETVAEQVIYPVAKDVHCGDRVNSVTALDGAIRVDEVLWVTSDVDLSCADYGTGLLVKDVALREIEGELYPIQIAPVVAWGGVCPQTRVEGYYQGVGIVGIEVRAAPPASAPLAVEPEQRFWMGAPEYAELIDDGLAAMYVPFVTEMPREPGGVEHCGFQNSLIAG